jgi:hypothetical protein
MWKSGQCGGEGKWMSDDDDTARATASQVAAVVAAFRCCLPWVGRGVRKGVLSLAGPTYMSSGKRCGGF